MIRTKTPSIAIGQRLRYATALAFVVSSLANAQTPAPAAPTADPVPTAEQLARYDLDKNGRLEGAEMDAFRADQMKVEEEILELSPFFITTKQDRGYFAANTLAGSRMNTKLSDLAPSISVVTKAQMEDFASTNINDVFRYEVNTEGANTYTPQTQAFRSDGLLDVNAGGTRGNQVSSYTSATANRLRGLGIPSSAINYYPAIDSIPADTYNLSSVEISRGPNSLLFGVGSPAGMVNQSTQQAALNQDTNRVVASFDDRGSVRTSLAVNQGLIEDKLAIFGAIVHDQRRFVRKPSYDNTRRMYGAITYKPFSKTTIRANVEDYTNHNRRPNTISPTDFVTQWNLAGRPTYDALTKRFTYLNTGVVTGPYVSHAGSSLIPGANAQAVRDYIMSLPNYNPALRNAGGTDTNFNTYNGVTIFGQAAITNYDSILFVPGVVQMNQGRPTYQIADGRVQNWYQPLYLQGYRTGWGTATNPLAAAPLIPADANAAWANAQWTDIYNRDTLQSGGWTNNAAVTKIGSYKYPGVTDRSIYDWKKDNILQANFGKETNRNYQVDLDQQITDDLFFSGGWFRQDFRQVTNYTIAQLQAAALTIDINKYNTDGTPNPYFGLPFVWDRDPDRFINTRKDDHFRAGLAYTPDLTTKANWLRFLGRHQVLAMWSRDEYMSSATRLRLASVAGGTPDARYRFLQNQNNNTDGSRTGWGFIPSNGATSARNFYLANPGDPMGVVTRGTGEWNAESYTGTVRVYNYATNTWENAPLTQAFTTFDSPSRNQRILDSLNFGLTSYLWKDRIISTLGTRFDEFRARGTTTGAYQVDGESLTPALTPQQKFNPDGTFNVDSVWNRFNKWYRMEKRTSTAGVVVRPFRGWSAVEQNSQGSQLWQIIRDFGISYNWSTNFDTPLGAENDAFGRELPKPKGIGQDFGFQFTALDNRLFARVTWFTAKNENARVGASTALTRMNSLLDTTLFRGWARTIALINRGQDPRQDQFDGAGRLSPAEELEVQAETARIWQQNYNYYNELPGAITSTGDAKSKGMEIQVNYNTDNWRNRFTFGSMTTKNYNVLKQYDEWYANRSAIWKAAQASAYLLPQYQNLVTYNSFGNTDATPNVNLANFWTSYGYNSAVRLSNSDGNTNVENYFGNVITPQIMQAQDLNGQVAPNQRKYRWAYNTGYDFTSGMFKGFGVGGAERWESKMVIGYYGRAAGTNTAIPGLLDVSDISRPIHAKANYYTDLFVRYRRNVWKDKVAMTIQLNVEDVFEDGHLQVVAVNYDGSPWGYRIVDSRKFTLTATFDF